MPTPDEGLPPNLKVLAQLLQAGSHPAVDGLLKELSVVADRIPRSAWEPVAAAAAPIPQILALGLAGSFAASGALSISVSGAGGDELEKCPVPGCGRQRTKK